MNPSLKLIALVGMPGSGKSIAADFFRKKNIPVLRFGDQTDIGVQELGLPLTEKNEREYREHIRKELGMAAMAIKIEPRIKALDNPIIVLDGMRSFEEYIYLKKIYIKLSVLCIYTRKEVRYQRLQNRIIRPLNSTESEERDIAEITKLNCGGPIAIADYLIKNETTMDDFVHELELFYDLRCK